jgi:HAD superfamily hydrolase (TIGR01509 family)
MSNESNIDCVLFDFGGVLAEEGFKKGLAVIAKLNRIDEETFTKTASDIIYSTGHIIGKATERDFWKEMRKKTGIVGDDIFFRNEILARFRLRPWMIDLVKGLKAEKITVGILSDQTQMLDKLDEKYEFFKWFDQVFNSYHFGKGKRDASLFDDIAGILKFEPRRILFIDDDLGHISRAKQKGWKAILYVDRESFQKDFEKILNWNFKISSKKSMYQRETSPGISTILRRKR